MSGFGGQGYVTPEQRGLSSIEKSPGPDLSQGEQAIITMLQTHDTQLKFIDGQVDKAMMCVNEATQNPIQQIQQFVADIIVLLGGGQLAHGALDLGDLQYILPAIGALFGFGEGPFPLSLFEAAMKFFVGYIVPQEQFVDIINMIIENWLGLLGIDPEFIADVKELTEAIGNLFGGISNLFPSLNELLSALGINAGDLGPLGQLLAPILRLFSGFNLDLFGNIVDFITDAISPFIEWLTAVINWINGVLAALGWGGGSIVNNPLAAVLEPFENMISFLGGSIFGSGFNPGAFFGDIFGPEGAIVDMFGAVGRLFGIGTDAQDTANLAMQEILAVRGELASSGDGEWFSDQLNYPSATYLPSPYIVHLDGGGAGTSAPNGKSELVWKPSGFGTRICLYDRPDFTLTTGQYGAAMVITGKGSASSNAAAVLGWVDGFGDGVAMLLRPNNSVLINPVTAYNLDGNVPADDTASFTQAAGDTFEIYYGATIADTFYPDAILVYRNRIRVWFCESSGISLGANVYPIVGQLAVPAVGFTQAVPPRVGSYAIFDSTLTL